MECRRPRELVSGILCASFTYWPECYVAWYRHGGRVSILRSQEFKVDLRLLYLSRSFFKTVRRLLFFVLGDLVVEENQWVFFLRVLFFSLMYHIFLSLDSYLFSSNLLLVIPHQHPFLGWVSLL